MNRNSWILLLSFILSWKALPAQTEAFSGTWKMTDLSLAGTGPVKVQLEIASPDRNALYPALLTLQCDSFKAAYELLLVKKNNWELGISKNKYVKSEAPFTLGNWTYFLNG